MALTVTLPHADPLFQAKRAVLQQHKLSTQQTFQLQRDKVRRPCTPPCTLHAEPSTLYCFNIYH